MQLKYPEQCQKKARVTTAMVQYQISVVYIASQNPHSQEKLVSSSRQLKAVDDDDDVYFIFTKFIKKYSTKHTSFQ